MPYITTDPYCECRMRYGASGCPSCTKWVTSLPNAGKNRPKKAGVITKAERAEALKAAKASSEAESRRERQAAEAQAQAEAEQAYREQEKAYREQQRQDVVEMLKVKVEAEAAAKRKAAAKKTREQEKRKAAAAAALTAVQVSKSKPKQTPKSKASDEPAATDTVAQQGHGKALWEHLRHGEQMRRVIASARRSEVLKALHQNDLQLRGALHELETARAELQEVDAEARALMMDEKFI